MIDIKTKCLLNFSPSILPKIISKSISFCLKFLWNIRISRKTTTTTKSNSTPYFFCHSLLNHNCEEQHKDSIAKLIEIILGKCFVIKYETILKTLERNRYDHVNFWTRTRDLLSPIFDEILKQFLRANPNPPEIFCCLYNIYILEFRK